MINLRLFDDFWRKHGRSGQEDKTMSVLQNVVCPLRPHGTAGVRRLRRQRQDDQVVVPFVSDLDDVRTKLVSRRMDLKFSAQMTSQLLILLKLFSAMAVRC